MNSFPFTHLPVVWFVSRRECLETYYQEFCGLQDKLTKLVGGQNIGAVTRASESMKQLAQQVRTMEETFDSHVSPYMDRYAAYNKNDLTRIRELATTVSNNLDTISRQMSWGLKADTQIAQVKRNLYPLLRLLEETLKWLERGT